MSGKGSSESPGRIDTWRSDADSTISSETRDYHTVGGGWPGGWDRDDAARLERDYGQSTGPHTPTDNVGRVCHQFSR